ncbi:hypothetical protein D3C80_1421890 [compost metagenome]
MVPEDHGIVADVVHELQVSQPFKLGEVQGAGEYIPCIEQDGVAGTFLLDRRHPFNDGFQMAVRVVRVQDSQGEVCIQVDLGQNRIMVGHSSAVCGEVCIQVDNINLSGGCQVFAYQNMIKHL